MNKFMLGGLAILMGISIAVVNEPLQTIDDSAKVERIENMVQNYRFLEEREGKESVHTRDSEVVKHLPDLEPGVCKARKVVYDNPLSENLQNWIQKKCIEYSISLEFVLALIEVESQYKADIVSADGTCIGLMQINVSCHKDRAKKLGINIADMKDPYFNTWIGIDYLSELFEKYEDVGLVLMAYNGGEVYMQNMVQSGIYTTKYTDKVFMIQDRIMFERYVKENCEEI